jgi:hypothetical protein
LTTTYYDTVDRVLSRQGLSLMRHFATIARAAGLQTLIAEVLPENTPMLQLFKTSRLQWSTKREAQVVHVTLRLF